MLDLVYPNPHDNLVLMGTDVTTVGNPDEILAKEGNTNQASDSTELEKSRKYGKCNLRKSLAWDSAFFTNAGKASMKTIGKRRKITVITVIDVFRLSHSCLLYHVYASSGILESYLV